MHELALPIGLTLILSMVATPLEIKYFNPPE
jgi:hypothetical protein